MKTILLLHGAIGSQSQLLPLKKLLSTAYQIHTFNFSGHGGNPLPDVFSIEIFANEVLTFCEANKLKQVNIFGYSMGGYVALYLARHQPELIESVVTLGTKLHWDEATAASETAMMNPEVIEQKVPKFAAQLQQLHAPQQWQTVLTKTTEMLTAMGIDNPLKPEDYLLINAAVLIMRGDRDKMVSLEETVAAYKQLSTAELCILPHTPHPIEQVDVELVNYLVKKFIQ